jgi:probable phosphoglycerate mutase
MTTRLILVRHGESEHLSRRVAGGLKGDTGLPATGRSQVELLAARLVRTAGCRGAVLYSSPLRRAKETASILARELNSAGVQEHCGLCSYHFSTEHDGQPLDELWAKARRGGGVTLFRPEHPGGDTWAQLVLRAGEALHEIADLNHGKTVVIATHGETIQASLIVLGYLPFRARMDVSIAPASITEWMTDDDTTAGGPPDWPFAAWTLVRLNDAAHLEP